MTSGAFFAGSIPAKKSLTVNRFVGSGLRAYRKDRPQLRTAPFWLLPLENFGRGPAPGHMDSPPAFEAPYLGDQSRHVVDCV